MAAKKYLFRTNVRLRQSTGRQLEELVKATNGEYRKADLIREAVEKYIPEQLRKLKNQQQL